VSGVTFFFVWAGYFHGD